MRLDEMEEFKGRDVAFVSDWLTKKVFKRSLLKIAGADNDCSININVYRDHKIYIQSQFERVHKTIYLIVLCTVYVVFPRHF